LRAPAGVEDEPRTRSHDDTLPQWQGALQCPTR